MKVLSYLNKINLGSTVGNCKPLPTVPGIYALKHIASGTIYIGSTYADGGIRARIRRHRRDLRFGRHCNPKLQCYFNKYGIDAFDVLVVELTTRESTREREQHYFDLFKPWVDGFNSARGVVTYEEPSDETRKAIAKAACKPYEVSYGGEIFSGENLTAFCRDKGLHQGAMTQVLLGKKPQYKGWTLPGGELPSREVIYHPTGEKFQIAYFGGNGFARSRDLSACLFNGVLSGARRIHKGWALAATDITEEELAVSLLSMADKRRINGRQAIEVLKGKPRSQFRRCPAGAPRQSQ